jgi:pyruvate dehydrogenase E1 component beta subunit
VIDPRTLEPLDTETLIGSVKKTGRAIIVTESVGRCGFSAEIAAILAKEAFDYLDAPIERLTAPPIPIPFAPKLESSVIPDEVRIVRAVQAMLGLRSAL